MTQVAELDGPFERPPESPSTLEGATEVGTSIELFTGGGGLAQAMHNVGFRHLLCNEFAKHACETLRGNTAVAWSADAELPSSVDDKWPLIEGDIHELFGGGRFEKSVFAPMEGKVDVVAGGPPCQPFSLGGVHKGDEDERNMFPQLFRVVRETRPRAIICENVRGLLRPSFRPYFDYIVRELTAPFEERNESEKWFEHDARLRALPDEPNHPAERYDVYVIEVNAADYGVPQIRHRVIIVAFRKDLGITWTPPATTHSERLLIEDQISGAYWERHGIKPTLDPKKYRAKAAPGSDNGGHHAPWLTVRDAIQQDPVLPNPILGKERRGFHHHVGWPGARIYKGHTPNLRDRPAKTVKAGVHGVPGGETVLLNANGTYRYMTVREVARVMTFPDHWWLAGPRGEQMRQLGNAVPVRLGEVFAKAVAKALKPRLTPTN